MNTHFAALSSNVGVSDWRLLRVETPLQCLAWGCGYRLYMCSERTALLARGLSGVSGLISKQTDLILMPCLQLLGPESLSAERSSCEPTNTTQSWYLVDHSTLHFSSIHPAAAVKIIIFGTRHNILLYIKEAKIIAPLQQRSIGVIIEDKSRENTSGNSLMALLFCSKKQTARLI